MDASIRVNGNVREWVGGQVARRVELRSVAGQQCMYRVEDD